jgi:soluble lytic murein transglycosylase-like protein
MRGVWWLGVVAVFVLPQGARADVFLYRDRLGAMHFTNAPAAGPSVVVMKERAPRQAAVVLPDPTRSWPSEWQSEWRTDWRGGRTPYDQLIREIADRYNVEYALVKAVIKTESDFDHRAISPKGAQGLMQLMPATAAQHQVRNAFFPRDNIEGGVQHLRMLLDRYPGNLPIVLAAYNAGIQRVEEAHGIPAIAETRDYVARVLRYRIGYLREGAGVLEVRR